MVIRPARVTRRRRRGVTGAATQTGGVNTSTLLLAVPTQLMRVAVSGLMGPGENMGVTSFVMANLATVGNTTGLIICN